MTATVLAVLALFVSCLTLGWQIISWFSAGARLKVKASNGFILPLDKPIDCILVSVANAGRLATTVSQVNFRRKRHWWSKDRGTVGVFAPAILMGTIPRKLEPGEEETIVIDVEQLAAILETHGVPVDELRPRAVTGHGDFLGKMKRPARDRLQDELNMRGAAARTVPTRAGEGRVR